MEPPTPDWLCKDFLTHCLRHEYGKEDIVVSNFTTSPAVPPGNNYGSCLVRVKLEYKESENDKESHDLSLIIKSELTEGAVKEMFDECVINNVEPTFYNQFIPEASKLTKTSFVPKSFFSIKPSVTILEDLKEQGYVMEDRMKQLDFEHCRLYAVAAATLHAISFAVFKKCPELKSIGNEKVFSNELRKGAETFKNMIKNAFKPFANYTESTDKFKKYSKVIRDTSLILWDKLVEVHKPSEEVLNTINQGDPWITNMMFKYDDAGKVAEIKLLDFQALRYGSPVNDLVFFIWSSANHDVKRDRLDELYRVYLDTLNNKLKELNCTECVSYENFMNNIKKLSYLSFFIVGAFLPSSCDPDPLDIALLGQMQNEGEESPYEKYYYEDHCINRVLNGLEDLELAGVFDYLEKYKT